MSKHTPGPWSYNRIQGHGGSEDRLAVVSKHEVIVDIPWKDRANARLIAAAPEMLQALHAARIYLEGHDKGVWADVCAAIAKAEGRDE